MIDFILNYLEETFKGLIVLGILWLLLPGFIAYLINSNKDNRHE